MAHRKNTTERCVSVQSAFTFAFEVNACLASHGVSISDRIDEHVDCPTVYKYYLRFDSALHIYCFNGFYISLIVDF